MPKQINSFSQKDDRGFTLVEILISLVLLLILVVAFVPMFTYVAQAMASNKARAAAVEIATMKMEELRALPYDAKDENFKIDPTKPQLGLKNGDPLGLVEPTETITDEKGREFLVTTDISWGDESKSFKIVSVIVESPGIFSEAVKIINKFDTMAAREGIDIHPGSIMVEVLNSKGEPLSNNLTITIKTEDFTESKQLNNGEVLFQDIPNGSYEVAVDVPHNLSIHPDLQINFDTERNSLIDNNVIITYNKKVKLSYVMDYGASLELKIKDQENKNIVTNKFYNGGILDIGWYESETSEAINILSIPVTRNEINNGQLSSYVERIWPGGNYIISFRIDKEIGDGENNKKEGSKLDFDMYNSYYNEKVQFTANSVKTITAQLELSKPKVILLGGKGVDYDGVSYPYAKKWKDQSGNNNYAENTTNDNNLRPRYFTRTQRQYMFFECENKDKNKDKKKQYLKLTSGAECTNNFTIFTTAKPTKEHLIELNELSSDPQNTDGISGQKYLLYPTQKNTDFNNNAADVAGMGISLGVNGVTVYEHGHYYMPAKASYEGTLSDMNVIAVKYSVNPDLSSKPVPSIYINGEHVTTGIPSNRSTVYSPKKIGGDDYGYYKGALKSVVVYDSPALDDYNINVVSEFLYTYYMSNDFD